MINRRVLTSLTFFCSSENIYFIVEISSHPCALDWHRERKARKGQNKLLATAKRDINAYIGASLFVASCVRVYVCVFGWERSTGGGSITRIRETREGGNREKVSSGVHRWCTRKDRCPDRNGGRRWHFSSY